MGSGCGFVAILAGFCANHDAALGSTVASSARRTFAQLRLGVASVESSISGGIHAHFPHVVLVDPMPPDPDPPDPALRDVRGVLQGGRDGSDEVARQLIVATHDGHPVAAEDPVGRDPEAGYPRVIEDPAAEAANAASVRRCMERMLHRPDHFGGPGGGWKRDVWQNRGSALHR